MVALRPQHHIRSTLPNGTLGLHGTHFENHGSVPSLPLDSELHRAPPPPPAPCPSPFCQEFRERQGMCIRRPHVALGLGRNPWAWACL